MFRQQQNNARRLLVLVLILAALAAYGSYAAFAQCTGCDTDFWQSYWNASFGTLTDYAVKCAGQLSTYTLTSDATMQTAITFANTAVGRPTGVQYNGNIYLIYGYHNWSLLNPYGQSEDKTYISTSSDGRSFFSHRAIVDAQKFCQKGVNQPGVNCEFWEPEVVINDSGRWHLFLSGHHVDGEQARIFMATSTDGGQTFNFNWVWNAARNEYQGIFDGDYGDGYSTYAWGGVTWDNSLFGGSGGFVYYAHRYNDARTYRFISQDGSSWQREASPLNFWGGQALSAHYDSTRGIFIMSWVPELRSITNCDYPLGWNAPVNLSSDGRNFGNTDNENYFGGYVDAGYEANPLGNRRGVIDAGISKLVYLNTNPRNYVPGNRIYVTGWHW